MDRIEPLIRRLERRDALSGEEKDVLARLVEREALYRPGDIIAREGVIQRTSQLLISGVAARSKQMEDGGRQITELHIDGDFVDLHSFLLKKLDHDVVAMSPIRMALVPHERLKAVTEEQPHLTRMLWLSTLIDSAIHREWIVSAGRRSALKQIACLFCEMLLRYEIVGLAQDGRCPMALTQNELADACGLTAVHVNRVLQELRAEGLVHWRRGELVVLDFERLASLGGFDPRYLNIDSEPR